MEFGSDFHSITDYPKADSPFFDDGTCRFYADGRQALEAILMKENVRRLWVPSYYCYESLEGVKRHGVNIAVYPCTPLRNAGEDIVYLPYEHGDALMRMNYFGLQSSPRPMDSEVLIIEDHSHNLSGSWALNSDADWCFASLRKTLPIADGGVLWSPRKRRMPNEPMLSQAAAQNAVCRYAAMELKADFLAGKDMAKDIFLNEFRRTEVNFDKLDISAISNVSKAIVGSIDILEWNRRKRENWDILRSSLIPGEYRILLTENELDTPFSLVLLFDSPVLRDKILKALIVKNVYPAVLWRIPEGNDVEAIEFGNRMLSIHCDARYTRDQMLVLAEIINNTLRND